MTEAPQPVGTRILDQVSGSIAQAEDTLLFLARDSETWVLYELPWPLPGNAMPRPVCNGFYDPRGIAIAKGGAYVVDAKILGRYTGAGGVWHVNLKNGDKTVLVGRPRPGGLWSVLRSRDRDVLPLGVLRWPTSITTHNETLLVTESRRLITLNTINGDIRPVGGKSFLNLNGVAHWHDAECLVFEHVLTTTRAPGPGVGTLWSIDLDDRRPPRCITGGFTNARGLQLNHNRTHAYIGEVQENGPWHVVRVDLSNGHREPLPGTYDGKPGFTITQDDELLVCTPDGILKRDL
jgi:hypothetical protein